MAEDKGNQEIINKDESVSGVAKPRFLNIIDYLNSLIKKTSQPAAKIIWYEIAAFGAIIVISWANELAGLAPKLLGGTYAPNWHDAAVESSITVIVALPTIIFSWRVSKRLHYLEGFLRVCAWCQKVGQGDEWISIGEFAQKRLNTQTTHGICPSCSQKLKGKKRQVI
jgi:hypothetical protein